MRICLGLDSLTEPGTPGAGSGVPEGRIDPARCYTQNRAGSSGAACAHETTGAWKGCHERIARTRGDRLPPVGPGARVVVTGMGAVSPTGSVSPASARLFAPGRAASAPYARSIPPLSPRASAARSPASTPRPSSPTRTSCARPARLGDAARRLRRALATPGSTPPPSRSEERRRFGVSIGTGGAVSRSPSACDLWYAGEREEGERLHDPRLDTGRWRARCRCATRCGAEPRALDRLHLSTDAIGYAARHPLRPRRPRARQRRRRAPRPGIFAAFSVMRIMTSSWNDEPARDRAPSRRTATASSSARAWTLVLEEDARARRRADPAEVLGYGSTCGQFHRVRLEENGIEPARADDPRDGGRVGPRTSTTRTSTGPPRSSTTGSRRALKLALGARRVRPGQRPQSMIGHPQARAARPESSRRSSRCAGSFRRPSTSTRPTPSAIDYVPNAARRGRIDVALCNCIGFGSKNSALVVARPRL